MTRKRGLLQRLGTERPVDVRMNRRKESGRIERWKRQSDKERERER